MSTDEATPMEPDLQVPDSLLPVLDALKQREPLFHAWTSEATPPDFERLVAPDFWEVGASGRRYGRAFVLEVVAQRGPDAQEAQWQTSDWHVRSIGLDHYLLTYTLRQPQRMTRRATLWQRTADGWQALYHQGTVVQDV